MVPGGGSHFARCSGLVHISNTRAIGASNVRLMTKRGLPVATSSRCSASRSHVALPPACLMCFAISAAASGDGSVKIISIVVLPFASLNVTVTRKSGRRVVGRPVVVDELLVRLDEVVLRQVRIVDAVRAVHRVAPVASGAQVLAVRGQREAARPPPFRDLLGDGPRVPHRAHRRVVDARDADLVRATSCGHVVLLVSWASASCAASSPRASEVEARRARSSGTHRGGRAAPPTLRGTDRSSRLPAARARASSRHGRS